MEIVYKACAAAICGCAACLLLKKANTETAYLLSAAIIAMILTASAALIKELFSFINNAVIYADLDNKYVYPLLKCLGIGLLIKFTAEICRDTSFGGIASSVEAIGAVSAMIVCIPLLNNLLKTICELV